MVLWSLLLLWSVVVVACDLAMSALLFFTLSFALIVLRSLGAAARIRRQSGARGSGHRARGFPVGVLGALPDKPTRAVAESVVLGCRLRTTMGRVTRSSAAWFPTPLDPNIKVTADGHVQHR